MIKHWLSFEIFAQLEARNLPTCGCKHTMDGLRNLLVLSITLFSTYTMPNKHYSSKPTWWHTTTWLSNIVWSRQKWDSETRNPPTCGCESVADGPTIMLGVFITLICIYTKPNKHYSSKRTSLRCHLMAKCCLKGGRKSRSDAEICQHVAVKVWSKDLQSCW